jgi:DNA excision repair protein ERCC-2
MSVRDLILEGGGKSFLPSQPIVSRAGLGRKIHSLLQNKKTGSSASYDKEEFITWQTEFQGFTFHIEGRADLVLRRGKKIRVEEIKTVTLSRSEFRELNPADYPASLRQASLYTYLLYVRDCHFRYETVVLFVNLINNRTRRCFIDFDPARCADYLNKCLQCVVDVLNRQQEEQSLKQAWARSLCFPLIEKRPGQETMMREVTSALEDRKDLLISAPTGTGKTAGVLYPAIAFALEHGKRIFYLTARTTQRLMVEETVRPLHEMGIPLKTIFLRASEQMCANDVHFCHESACRRAAEHNERMAALNPASTLFEDPMLTADKVYQAGVHLGLCPFELSLDLTLAADLIVCDLNYVFDPGVYLKRFFLNRDYSDCILIIDEAHNLYSRGRQAFSPELKRRELQQLSDQVKRSRSKIHRAFKGFFQELDELFDRYQKMGEWEHPEQRMYECDLDRDWWKIKTEELEELYLEYFLYKVAKNSFRPDDPMDLAYHKIRAFNRVAQVAGSEFRILYDAADNGVLKIFCCDPSCVLGERIAGFHTTIAMSATLEPLGFFGDVLGFRSGHTRLRSLPSPFPPENRLFVVVDSINTRYGDRKSSYQPIAQFIQEVIQVKPGNYLAFFPSFEYLQAVRVFLPWRGIEIMVQRPDMEEKKRTAILKKMARSDTPKLLMAVMGGIFSEGVDYPGEMAIGAFIVSPALPALSHEQEILRDYYEVKCGMGFDYAYIYPGMNRVIQAAGRVIRTPKDKGVMVLIGERFAESRYQRLFPEYWYDRKVEDLVVENPVERIQRFWGKTA